MKPARALAAVLLAAAAQEACGEDLKRLCPGKPGDCMEEKKDQLSPACREFRGRKRGKKVLHPAPPAAPAKKN